MQGSAQTAPIFHTALIVAPEQAYGQTHQTCLRHCGIERFSSRSRGIEAARLLAEQRHDLILCENQLKDMSGIDFLRLVRLHPGLGDIPALLISSDARGQDVRTAIEAGYAGILLKPYSLQGMERQVQRLGDFATAPPPEDASIENFERTLHELSLLMRNGPSHALCQQGVVLLKSKRYAEAREAFLKAEALGDLPPEARLALAKAYQGLSDLRAARRCLELALSSFSERVKAPDPAERFPSLKIPHASAEESTLTAQLARASYFNATPGQARRHLEAGRIALQTLQQRKNNGATELDFIEELESSGKSPDLKVYLSVIGHTIKTYFKGRSETPVPAELRSTNQRLQ